MAIAILFGRDENEKKLNQWFVQAVSHELLKSNPNADIRVWPDMGRADEIDLAFVWRHPLGALKQFPYLKCIASLGAGVDHIIVDTELPHHVPIIRVMDPDMANDIVQYVLMCVLHDIKRVDHWESCQKETRWSKQPPFNFTDKMIGIMGLGFLGKKTAHILQDIGLNVIGWSRSQKNFSSIKTFAGFDELPVFLSQTDILVCMLPLTPQTENILNRKTFSQLKSEACLINLGRGGHLVEEDLIPCLDSGQLSTSYLDVFREEPLPQQHPFWTHPNIRITPHVASVTRPETAIPQLMDVYRRLLLGEKINNLVDLAKGY